MDPEKFASVFRQELKPIVEELERIRLLLERSLAFREGLHFGTTVPLHDTSDAESPLATSLAERRAIEPMTKADAAAAASAAVAAATASVARAAGFAAARLATQDARTATPRPPSEESALLGQLLELYPDDAAAVFFAFDRQFRCAPDRLDRLAVGAGLEAAWMAANRASVRALVERNHGGLALVAEMLGRDTDSLQALIDRIGLRAVVESVCERERRHLRDAPLPVRLSQLLFREKLARDLGMVRELDERTWTDLQQRCATLSGECETATDVLERLAEECNLDAVGMERMLRRYEVRSFVADLFDQPVDSVPRVVRRTGRPGGRRALEDAEIETRILNMLLTKGKVGSAHTHIDHLVRTVPTHERGRAREAIERLIAAGTLTLKVTDNSSEPHVSLAVGAVRETEARLREAALRIPTSTEDDEPVVSPSSP